MLFVMYFVIFLGADNRLGTFQIAACFGWKIKMFLRKRTSEFQILISRVAKYQKFAENISMGSFGSWL